MKKACFILLICLLAMAGAANAEPKALNTWVRIGQDSAGMYHYFSSASIKQYPPNDGTVFDVSVRAVVNGAARKKEKALARVSYLVYTTHYDEGRRVYQRLSTVGYDAQGKVVQRNDEAKAEMTIEPDSLAEQTLSAVRDWLAKNS